MASDATRGLLRRFGTAMTECEDALDQLEAAVQAGRLGTTSFDAARAYAQATRELSARWAEMSALVHGYHTRAVAAMGASFRAGSAG